jgi:uncharacterized MAPEG superfamily protein
MPIELSVLLGVCVYGAIQALLTGPVPALQQIHRNFSETFYLFAVCVLALHALDAFGAWSQKGAIVYAVGRALYLIVSAPPLRVVRKWAWAISLAGIVGCAAEVLRALLALSSA